MMLLCYHRMVPVQYLCNIVAVTVRFLCDLTETHLALIKLRIGFTLNKEIDIMKHQDIILVHKLIFNSNQRSLDITISCSQNLDYYITILRIYGM